MRRHACALFIRLGKIHSKTMISLFALLKSYIDNISEQQDTDMSQLEKCLLYEGLLTIRLVVVIFKSLNYARLSFNTVQLNFCFTAMSSLIICNRKILSMKLLLL